MNLRKLIIMGVVFAVLGIVVLSGAGALEELQRWLTPIVSLCLLVWIIDTSDNIQKIKDELAYRNSIEVASKNPFGLAKERYANGEITKAEFDEIKQNLTDR